MDSITERFRSFLMALMIGIGLAGITGCNEGPFEEFGETIDDAVDEVEDEIE